MSIPPLLMIVLIIVGTIILAPVLKYALCFLAVGIGFVWTRAYRLLNPPPVPLTGQVTHGTTMAHRIVDGVCVGIPVEYSMHS